MRKNKNPSTTAGYSRIMVRNQSLDGIRIEIAAVIAISLAPAYLWGFYDQFGSTTGTIYLLLGLAYTYAGFLFGHWYLDGLDPVEQQLASQRNGKN